jgi:hypothetical protein
VHFDVDKPFAIQLPPDHASMKAESVCIAFAESWYKGRKATATSRAMRGFSLASPEQAQSIDWAKALVPSNAPEMVFFSR